MAEIDEATWNASALTVPIAGAAAPMRLVLVAPLDNAAKLLDAARKGQLPPSAALLAPAAIASLFAVVCAAHRVADKPRLHAHTRAAELVYQLATRAAVGAAFAECGLARRDKAVLLAFVAPEPADEAAVRAVVRGTLRPLVSLSVADDTSASTNAGAVNSAANATAHAEAELLALRDEARVRKLYDIDDVELSCSSLEDAALNRIALFAVTTNEANRKDESD